MEIRCFWLQRGSTARVWSNYKPADDKIPLDRLSPKSQKKIAPPELEEEFAVDRSIHIHEPDGSSELLSSFPHAIDRDEPGVVLGSHNLAGKYIH